MYPRNSDLIDEFVYAAANPKRPKHVGARSRPPIDLQ